MEPSIKPACPDVIREAADALKKGQLVILPTETVYGLGADARNSDAVARIYAAKTRPSFNPLIIHVASAEVAARYAVLDETARTLAAAFWPGPFTLVLPLRPDSGIAPAVSAGLTTVAVRVPAHPLAHALLEAFDGPVAAPSANRSGRISPTTAAHAASELGPQVALIVDGGPCEEGLESTIVAISDGFLDLLRPGSVTPEELELVSGLPVRGTGPEAADRPTAPGQLASHYAPRAAVRLEVLVPKDGEVLLGFGPEAPAAALNLSPSGDLREAAANLFAMLRTLDDGRAQVIAVMPIPERGIGIAINDRLRRAAAPRG
ncbi:L-threonylcarbamoyladenylate synthase [Govanella unica]|uniref:Threonylcarbamoyl-AMP synthase n=1 Tax=Govanella unica TaxID=2975056 RepID=A0A9X3TYE1_9PROT|nr:L-threonylcarbamoyladenylate synthase [Govania unica]MDA5194024.1 L-threonylcarbamoyladenylate synthase [Govania unica]